ncbi:MAG: hypothetical protein H8F28_13050, partial [Fibrella sp.]|nr:hypothetical protein [Armatimonadota bacterium]
MPRIFSSRLPMGMLACGALAAVIYTSYAKVPSPVQDSNPPADFAVPGRWKLTEDTRTAGLSWDKSIFRSPSSSLRLETKAAPANKAVAVYSVEQLPAPGTPFRLRGFTKATGSDWKQFGMVLQVFNGDWSKQLAWITVDAPHEADWKGFDQGITLPDGASHAVLYFSVEGTGSAWLDDLSVKTVAAPASASTAPGAIRATEPVTVKPERPAYKWGSVVMGGVEYATGLVWSPAHPEALFLRADGGGIWRLDRKKRAWVPLLDQQTWKDRNLNTVDSLAVDPTNPRVLYIAGGGSRWGKPHDVLKSVDGGVTWRRTLLENEQGEDVISEGNGGDKQGGERLLVDPRDPQTVWFATRNDGLFVSRDGAKTWHSVKSFPTKGGRWHGLTFVAADAARNTLYVGVHSGAATDDPNTARIAGAIYRSIDNGATWESITSREKGDPGGESSPLRMRVAPDGTAYATYNGTGSWDTGGVGGGVWKYAKGSWRDITPAQGKDKPFCGINLHPKDPRKILCAMTYNTDGTIYYSENAGETWREYRYDKNNHDAGTLVLGDFPAWERGPGHSWGGNASDVAFDPVDPAVVYFTSFSGPCVGTGLGTDRMRFSLLGDGREQITTASGVSPSEGAPFVSGVWDVGGFRHESFDKIPATRSPLLDAKGAAFTGYDAYRNSFQDTFDMDASPRMPDVIVAAGGWQWNMTGTAAVSRDNGRTFREFASKPTPDAKFGRIAVSATDADNVIWVPMNNG